MSAETSSPPRGADAGAREDEPPAIAATTDPELEGSALPATPAVLAARADDARRRRIRLAALFVVLVALFGIGWASGLDAYLDRDRIRALVEGWGALGPLAFAVLFAVGELVHVPGWVFVGAAIVVWGPYLGALFAFFGANVSVTFSFLLVRTIGGKAFDTVDRPLVRRLLARLDEYPVLVVAALRVVLFALPALNYGLALTRIRLRDYVLGSALGLIPPIVVLTALFSAALGG